MSKRIKPVQPGQTFGDLGTRWYWDTKSEERVWKCVCTCGGYCMVREHDLTEHLVTNCGCKGGYGR